MKALIRRSWKKCICSAAQLYTVLCRPLFYFCLLLSLAPSALLGALLGWKAIFFPTAMPSLHWGIFLPAWFVISCGIPSLCASVTLALPGRLCGRCLTVLTPICTMQLLLAYLWALFLLYHFPPLFCILASLACAITVLLCIRYAARLGMLVGGLQLFYSIWNVYLVFLCALF